MGESLKTAASRTYSEMGKALSGNVSLLDDIQADLMIATRWVSGQNYSDRIWSNKDKLLGYLDKELRNGIIRGDDFKTLVGHLKTVTGTAKKDAERLVRTESSYIANRANMQNYLDNGLGWYEYLAVEDSRTSDACSGLNGRILPLDKAVIGTNYPPLHPNCRSRGLPVSNRRSAQFIQNKAKEMDKNITPDVTKTIEKFGGKLEGLEYKIKSVDSIKEKLIKNTMNIKDSLRFSSITNKEHIVQHYFNSIDELKKKGYNIVAVKNSWLQKSNSYKGININLAKDDFIFEIQFHTPESFDMKHNILHDSYEKYRRLDHNSLEARKLNKKMQMLSNGLVKPLNIERIK